MKTVSWCFDYVFIKFVFSLYLKHIYFSSVLCFVSLYALSAFHWVVLDESIDLIKYMIFNSTFHN